MIFLAQQVNSTPTEPIVTFMEILLPALISSAVTIIGFIVNYSLTKKSFKDEISKMKKAKMIENNDELIRRFMEMLTFSPKEIEKKGVDYYKETANLVYEYGSKEVIEIFADFQQSNYSKEKDVVKTFAYICLILSQIKYDLVGEVIKPNIILKIKLKDYSTSDILKNISKEIDDMIDYYKLNSDFKIND